MPPRERSTLTVLDNLKGEPAGLTRGELIERTKLARPTVYDVVEELLGSSVIKELGPARKTSTPGPPAKRLVLSRPAGVYAGLDLGQGHIAVAIGDASGAITAGPVLAEIDVGQQGRAALIKAVRMVGKLLERDRLPAELLRGVVIGIPAPLDLKGNVVSDYLPRWTKVPIKGVLSEELENLGEGCKPLITIANDANLGVLGEVWHGVARGRSDVVYVKVSTGVGMGVCLGGELWRGSHGLAGEFGHTTISAEAEEVISASQFDLESPRVECARCQQLRCLENLVSCRAIVDQLLALQRPEYTRPLAFDEVVRRAVQEPVRYEQCHRVLSNAATRLAHSLADVVRVLDPEMVVLGGFLALAGKLVAEPIRHELNAALPGGARVALELVSGNEIRHSEVKGALALAVANAELEVPAAAD